MRGNARKIFVLTGKRGGFGAMKPMLRLMRDDPGIALQLGVTDQHLDPKFGKTISEVQQEFEIAASIPLNQKDDSAAERASALGTCLQGTSLEFARLKPDVVVLYGDRGEVLSAAVAATCFGIPIAHLQGGDVSGSVDEQMRHAVTKLSHLHFPSTEQSAARIRGMGEEPWRIHIVGDNHLDLIVAGDFASAVVVERQLGVDLDEPVVVVLQHPETTSPQASHQQMVETLLAVRKLGRQTVVIYPCSDVGYGGVVRAIEELAVGPRFKVFKNLDAPIFWGLLARAAVLVGNSSAGLIETPTFRLPAINVGRRQEGRLHAENVMHAAHSQDEIFHCLQRVFADKQYQAQVANCSQPYGDGHAGERVVNILKQVDLDRRLLVKRMTY